MAKLHHKATDQTIEVSEATLDGATTVCVEELGWWTLDKDGWFEHAKPKDNAEVGNAIKIGLPPGLVGCEVDECCDDDACSDEEECEEEKKEE